MHRNNLRHGGALLFFSTLLALAAVVALVADVVDVLR